MKRLTAVAVSIAVLGITGWLIQPQGFAASAAGPAKSAAAPVDPPPPREPDVLYVPTPEAVVIGMLEMAKVGPDDTVYDLGSGDGRIVIAAAKRFGAKGVGIDIDPVRVREARENVRRAGVADRVQILQGDLFQADLRQATVVTLYLLQELNERLRPKLQRELRPGGRVVSQTFDMGDWKADARREIEGKWVYLWTIRR